MSQHLVRSQCIFALRGHYPSQRDITSQHGAGQKPVKHCPADPGTSTYPKPVYITLPDRYVWGIQACSAAHEMRVYGKAPAFAGTFSCTLGLSNNLFLLTEIKRVVKAVSNRATALPGGRVRLWGGSIAHCHHVDEI